MTTKTKKSAKKKKLTPQQKLRARAAVKRETVTANLREIGKLQTARDRQLNKLGPRIDRYLSVAADAKTAATEKKNRDFAAQLGKEADQVERDYNKLIGKLERANDKLESQADELEGQAVDLDVEQSRE